MWGCCECCLRIIEALLHKDQINPIPDFANIPAEAMLLYTSVCSSLLADVLCLHTDPSVLIVAFKEQLHLSMGFGASLGFHLAKYVAKATCMSA